MTPFTIASSYSILGKQAQLDLWMEFAVLPKLLKSKGLEVTPGNIKSLLATADPSRKQKIRRALRAKDELIFANQALCIKIAKRYVNSRFNLEELVQIANLGLATAMFKFVPNKNAKFSSYAYFWIRATILEALNRSDPIYVPPKAKERQKYQFFSPQDDRLDELSSESTTSTLDELFLELEESDRELLEIAFGLNSDTNVMSAALFKGWSIDRVNEEIEALLERFRSDLC
jgi:RNA polymerase sigma factor (sigma-70 family)